MRKKVLIVDDEPNIVISLEFLMNKQGYQVAIARNGQEALGRIRADPPDLVVLDVMMPRMNGFEVCETIRNDPTLSDIRILMLTAKGRDAEMKKGLSLGADAYMPKPFSTHELIEKANELLAVAS